MTEKICVNHEVRVRHKLHYIRNLYSQKKKIDAFTLQPIRYSVNVNMKIPEEGYPLICQTTILLRNTLYTLILTIVIEFQLSVEYRVHSQ